MAIEGFFIPEPHRGLQEHAILKNQLDRLLESPFAQIERQRDEIHRLTEPFSLMERTLHQTAQMEYPSRCAAEIERMMARRHEIESGSHVAAEVQRLAHLKHEMESIPRAAIDSSAAVLLPQHSSERRTPMSTPFPSLKIGPSLINRIEEAIERKMRQPVVYNVTGPNARLNFGSVDSSTNIVNVAPTELFTQLRLTIEEKVQAEQERDELLARLADLQSAQGTPTYLDRYQRFIAAAANHMTILAPFLPALTQLMGKLG